MDRTDKLVTIIVPCFDQGHFLADALDSVLGQTHPAWECIVVNDGSSDATADVAERYAARDSRVRLFSQENRGLSAARNIGLNLARGRYVQFLDADDWIAPEKLERQVNVLATCDAPAAAYCYFHFADPHDISKTMRSGRDCPRLSSVDPFHDIAWRWELDLTLPAHCFLFDTRLFAADNIRFDENLPNHEDWDCWLRIFRGVPALVLVEAHLAVYRLGSGSLSKNTVRMWQGARTVCLKHRSVSAVDAELFDRKRRDLYKTYRAKRTREILCSAFGEVLYESYYAHTPWPLQRLVNAAIGSIGLHGRLGASTLLQSLKVGHKRTTSIG
jgi:glycosyltransferase involved in cell wall biosynthesis